MARTRQTARKATGGIAFSRIWESDYSESGDDSSHSSEETDYSLLSSESEETSYDEKMRRDLISKVLHTQVLLSYIYTFIGEDSILFINSHIYKILKKSVLIINLSRSQSQKYLLSKHFRVKIRSLVKYTSKQLNLDISYSDDFQGSYQQSRVVKKCLSLNLKNCLSLTNVSKFTDLESLNLTYCPKINDVSMLGKIRNLNLTGCTGINDFSKLGSVHCLNLSSTFINDTRGLEKVHTLILNNCGHLKILSSVHSNINLRLDNNRHISSVGQLKNVKCLILRSLPLIEVNELCNVSFLSISRCLTLTEIKGLNNVKLLSLHALPSLDRINISSNHEMLLVKDEDNNCSVKYIFKNDTVIMERGRSWSIEKLKYLKDKMRIFKVLNRDSFKVEL